MADKIVDVPGLGVVSFPSDMPDARINLFIRDHLAKKQAAPIQAKQAEPTPIPTPPVPAEKEIPSPVVSVPESTSEEPPKEEEKPEEKETKYKFGNTQADIPSDSEAGKALSEARAKIDKDDLMPSTNTTDGGGLEENSHITIRYGIDGDDTARIKEYLEKQAPFEATLGKTTSFPPSEHSDGAAPIVVSIESPELHKMEEELDQHGNFIERSFPEYKPHVTLGYVKPEVAEKYVGMDGMEGKKFTINSVSISNRDGSIEPVEFKGKPEEETPSPDAPSETHEAEQEPAKVEHPETKPDEPTAETYLTEVKFPPGSQLSDSVSSPEASPKAPESPTARQDDQKVPSAITFSPSASEPSNGEVALQSAGGKSSSEILKESQPKAVSLQSLKAQAAMLNPSNHFVRSPDGHVHVFPDAAKAAAFKAAAEAIK